MDNQRNVILAIALSLMVLIGWQYFVAGPRVEAERQRQIAEQNRQADAGGAGAPAVPQAGAADPGAPLAPGAAPAQATPRMTREAALQQSARVPIETPALKGSINLTGGRIDDLLLAEYRVTVDPRSPLVELFSPLGSPQPYYADFGWMTPPGAAPVALPGPDAVWTAEGGPLTPGRDVTLTWDNGAGLVFRRTIGVDEHYMFTVRQSVENRTGQPVTLHPYGLVSRHGLPRTEGYFILHEGLIGVFGEEGLAEVDYDELDEEPIVTPPPVREGWLGITDKYWASALVPAASGPFQGTFTRTAAGGTPIYQANFVADPVTIAPGAEARYDTLLFAGAKEVDVIDAYDDDLGIERFELLIDWGWFYFITKPMFYIIDWLYRFLGNFGLAILAVTVVVKLLFFPLANKSYASMSKMKKVQPEVQKLQQRFKDDRMAMQQAMMELYRNEKINPLSGCWPIVVQIPVFFALYKVLFVTIEMRHAPFFGWIRDLSAPDPTSIFNLFGLLPYGVPEFLMIGVWPLIMGVTMFVQMQLNPTPPDKTQAMIFNWMPVIFTIMLASFPAGLVIYWAWNNTLSIIQQAVIMKRYGVKVELWDNLKGLFVRKPKGSPAE